jgi:hypothetical protein
MDVQIAGQSGQALLPEYVLVQVVAVEGSFSGSGGRMETDQVARQRAARFPRCRAAPQRGGVETATGPHARLG